MKYLKLLKNRIQILKESIAHHKIRTFLLLLLYPNIVCFTPNSTDTSNTAIDFLLGLGRYVNVTYDCAGNVTGVTKYDFVDYGLEVKHNIDAFKFGVRGGGYSISNVGHEGSDYYSDYYDENKSVQYLNPFIGFETKYVEANFGLVFFNSYGYYGDVEEYFIVLNSKTQVSWVLRIGNKQKFHFSTQYLSMVPIFSGTGMIDFGFGFGSTESRNLTWIGFSGGPFQGFGVAARQDVELTDNMDLLLRGRIGGKEDNFEGSISAGLRFNI